MACNCDCYFGCDTRRNRLRFLAFGVLLMSYLTTQIYLTAKQRACTSRFFPEECHKYDPNPFKWSGFGKLEGSGQRLQDDAENRHVPDECIKGYAGYLDCIIELLFSPLVPLAQILLVALFVPLAMMCCCTKNPHKLNYEPVATHAPLVQDPAATPPQIYV